MDLHQNARLTLHSREALAQAVLSQQLTWNAAAAAFRVSVKTARKWVRRYRGEGRAGLCDRSSRPHRSPRQLPSAAAEQVLQLRRQRWTGVRIAQTTGLCRATVSRILRRHRLSHARDLEPSLPVHRYEHPHPGDLLHLDTKKLARIAKPGHRLTGDPRDETRGAGWEMLHVAIDDHSRIAFSRLYPDERAASTVAFLRTAVTYYARFGIRHLRTRPYTPRTNGKAERFIQTSLREWAYARIYQNSGERQAQLDPWLHQYNWHRPHASLGQSPPISRSGLDGNNLLRHHI